jgi:hypothetical protein
MGRLSSGSLVWGLSIYFVLFSSCRCCTSCALPCLLIKLSAVQKKKKQGRGVKNHILCTNIF